MNLIEQLSKPQSKSNADRITRWALREKSNFSALLKLVFGNEERMAQLAAWPLNEAARKKPEWILPHTTALFKLIEKKTHAAVARNILRIYEEIELPKKDLGRMTSICFSILQNPGRTIAERAYAMGILSRICEKEPDLARELLLVADDCLQEQIPALTARVKMVHKKFGKKEK